MIIVLMVGAKVVGPFLAFCQMRASCLLWLPHKLEPGGSRAFATMSMLTIRNNYHSQNDKMRSVKKAISIHNNNIHSHRWSTRK